MSNNSSGKSMVQAVTLLTALRMFTNGNLVHDALIMIIMIMIMKTKMSKRTPDSPPWACSQMVNSKLYAVVVINDDF